MNKIKFALFGFGYWGKHYARIIDDMEGAELKYIVEPYSDSWVMNKYLSTTWTTEVSDLLNDAADYDAAIVATPASTHYGLCSKILEYGKHILCEKPLAILPSNFQNLYSKALDCEAIIFPGQTYLFHSAVNWLKSYFQGQQQGFPIASSIAYIEGVRSNFGPIRTDVNPALDLMTHDLSILAHIFENKIYTTEYKFWGRDTTENLPDSEWVQGYGFDDTGGSFTFNLKCSWVEPPKKREMKFLCIDEYGEYFSIIYDDTQLYPIKFFQQNGNNKTIEAPIDRSIEPLTEQVKSFIWQIKQNQTPVYEQQNAMKVSQMLHKTHVGYKLKE